MDALTPEETQALIQTVLALGGLSAGVVSAVMEWLVKPLTEGEELPNAQDEILRKAKRKKVRKLASALLSVGLPSVYLALTHQVGWGALPILIVMSYGASELTHRKRKKNESTEETE